jgi:hypothetical protein
MTVTTFDVSAHAQDTNARYDHTAWPPSGGTFTPFDAAGVLFIKKYFGAGSYQANVGLIRWDTSSIPDTDTITAATLSVKIADIPSNGNGMSLVGDYYDFGGTPAVAADWIETASPSIWTPAAVSTFTNGQRKILTLTDLSGINKTGYTGIRLTLSAGTPTSNNELHIREYTGSNPGDYVILEVTHSAVTLDSCLPDADVTTTGWSTAPLFSKVNDASDATVIQATAS